MGGVLYEPNPQNLEALCLVCYLKFGGIKHLQVPIVKTARGSGPAAAFLRRRALPPSPEQ